MKINKKLFNSLTREPNIVHDADNEKIVMVYFMTKEEQEKYDAEQIYSIWASDGKKIYKILVSKEYYDYKNIKLAFRPDVNNIWIKYFNRMEKLNNKGLWILLPLLLIFIAAVAVSLTVKALNPYKVYIILGVFVAILIANLIQNRILNNKMNKIEDETQEELSRQLGLDTFNKVAEEQKEFYTMKDKQRQEQLDMLELQKLRRKEEKRNKKQNKKDDKPEVTRTEVEPVREEPTSEPVAEKEYVVVHEPHPQEQVKEEPKKEDKKEEVTKPKQEAKPAPKKQGAKPAPKKQEAKPAPKKEVKKDNRPKLIERQYREGDFIVIENYTEDDDNYKRMSQKELNLYTKLQLTNIARNMKITGYSNKNKKDLVNLIYNAQPREEEMVFVEAKVDEDEE